MHSCKLIQNTYVASRTNNLKATSSWIIIIWIIDRCGNISRHLVSGLIAFEYTLKSLYYIWAQIVLHFFEAKLAYNCTHRCNHYKATIFLSNEAYSQNIYVCYKKQQIRNELLNVNSSSDITCRTSWRI